MTVIGQGVKLLLNTASIVVLARILTPEDYGIVGMAAVVFSFISLLKDLGLTFSIVQSPDVNDEQLSSLFWTNLIFGFLLCGSGILISPFLARLYGEARVAQAMEIYSLDFVLSGLITVHQSLVRRKMLFKRLVTIDVSSTFVGLGASVMLALLGCGYISPIIGAIATDCCTAVMVWFVAQWRPKAMLRWSSMKDLMGFGGQLMGFNILNFLSRNLDNFLVGKYIGPTALGSYSRAYSLFLQPINQINLPISYVATPVLSRLRDSEDSYRRAYTQILQIVTLAAFPLVIYLYFSSSALVSLFLGDKWITVTPILRFLSIVGLVQPISNTTGWLFVSQGRAKDQLIWGVIDSVLTIAAFIAGLPWGVEGVAAFYSITGVVIRTPILIWIVGRKGPVRSHDLVKTSLPALGIGAVLVAELSICEYALRLPSPLVVAVVNLLIVLMTSLGLVFLKKQGRDGIRRFVKEVSKAMG